MKSICKFSTLQKAKEMMASELEFIKKVKVVFSESNQIDRYYRFASALKGFKTHKINGSHVVSEAKIVFEEHEDLYLEFLNFLPSNLKKIHIKEFRAAAFINKVRNRFISNEALYKSFLENMSKYDEREFLNNSDDLTLYNSSPARTMVSQFTVYEFYKAMWDIFCGQVDLMHEFEELLEDITASKWTEIKNLFMDDRMSDIDVDLSTLNSTITHIGSILQRQRHFVIKEFDPRELKWIRKHSSDIMANLKENSRAVLPEILSRLQEKENELLNAKIYSYESRGELNRLRVQRINL